MKTNTYLVCVTGGSSKTNTALQTKVLPNSNCRPIRWDNQRGIITDLHCDWIGIDTERGEYDAGNFDSILTVLHRSDSIIVNCCRNMDGLVELLNIMFPTVKIYFDDGQEQAKALNILRERCSVKESGPYELEIPSAAMPCLVAHGVEFAQPA